MLKVHIVISDRGWILERLAAEIASRYEYVTYSTEVDPNAPIQYYMTYGTWKGRVSPFEISFFTHLEPHGKARDRFFHVAANTDYCVCMSKLYEDLLRQEGINNVTTISPGVDLERFTPKVKIGVVGRTYHTGRKGENLVADVLDIPEIEWHFTGDGWPYPGLHLPNDKMPDFYRSMDYILVPSLYEGGPMCVLEALACGKEVIAPAVGWVPQYPHIEFETGNSQDLRRVLKEVVGHRLELRKSVLERTWDNWAAGHDAVFRDCYQKLSQTGAMGASKSAYVPLEAELTQARIVLTMHGDEHKSKGGPTVRVPKTAEHLQMRGVQAKSISYPASDISEYDLIHAFNVWPPETALDLLKAVKYGGKHLVLSSIFLDLSETQGFSSEVVNVFDTAITPQEIDRQLAKLRSDNVVSPNNYQNPTEPRPGYFAKVRRMVELADRTILLSEKERELLKAIGAVPKASSIVHNPVDVATFRNADPKLFAEKYNVKDYVLCVGRIEPRKNQLMLIHALRDLNIPLVLVGHSGGKYLEVIKRFDNKNLKIVDRLPPNSEILASAYAGARVFVLPSWSEGASLAALEAAAAGVNLVLSNRSSEQEYFKNYAKYCDPGDPESIRLAVESAYQNPLNEYQRKQQQLYVETEFSWTAYTQKTIEVYKKVLNGKAEPLNLTSQKTRLCEPNTIYVDLTTSANYTGRWSGIARLEFMLAKSLFELMPYDVKFIVWNSPSGYYFEVPPPEEISLEQLTTVARKPIESFPEFIHQPTFEKNSVVFMMGSSWMQNQGYVYSLLHTCKCNQLKLAFVSADIIPVKFPEWMPPGYNSKFLPHLKLLLEYSDFIFAISEHTKKDLLEFAKQESLRVPEIQVFRLGDVILETYDSFGTGKESQELLKQLTPGNFVLNVGAVHYRKNAHLLYNIWMRLVDDMGYEKLPKLVIVGGFSWNSDNFANLLEHSKLKEKILVLEGINDEELSWLYRNCMFTAYPSLYEGWGLPVAESLRYGKLCIASKISSVPEIAPDLTKLIDPLNTIEWYNTIKFYITSQKARQSAEQQISDRYIPTTWSDTAAQIKSLLKLPYQSDENEYEYFLGEMLNFAHPYSVLKYQTQGWFKTEKWGGAWTNGDVASLRFKINELASNFICLQCLCAAYIVKPQHSHVFVQIYVNGKYLKTWNFYDDSFREYYVDIPVDIINSSGLLNLTFHIFEPASPKTIQGKDQGDRRLLSLKVSKMRLIDPSYPKKPLLNYYPDVPTQPVYPFGSMLTLGDSKAEELVFVDSYHGDNNWGYFTTGNLTRIVIFPNYQPEEEVELRLKIRPVATPDFLLDCLVTVNKCLVGRLKAMDSKLTEYSIAIPARVFKLMLPVVIEFHSETVSSPQELNIDKNNQQFLFGISNVSLNKITQKTNAEFKISGSQEDNPYQLGEVLDFTQYSKVRPILGGDWHFYEPDGVWSSQEKASIYLDLNLLPTSDLVLLMMIELPYGGDFSQLRLSVNDKVLESSVFVSHGVVWCRCDVPRDVLLATKIKIDLTTPLVSICKVEDQAFPVGIKLSKMIINFA